MRQITIGIPDFCIDWSGQQKPYDFFSFLELIYYT